MRMSRGKINRTIIVVSLWHHLDGFEEPPFPVVYESDRLAPTLVTRAASISAAVAFAACGGGQPGVHVYNRTDVALAVGFFDPIAPCSDRFVPSSESSDSSGDPAYGAWKPRFGIAPAAGTTVVWLVVTANGTKVLSEPPSQLLPCGGKPVDWVP